MGNHRFTIPGLSQWKISEEAELNGKEWITRGSFEWDITSLGALN